MTMWKCEGRCVVILVTFMVQTLFIISGVGAENTTVMTSLPQLTKSKAVTSASVPTPWKGTRTPAQSSITTPPQLSEQPSIQNSISSLVQATTDYHKTSSVAPSPQTSITTSLTSSVSRPVQTTTDAHKTSSVAPSPQTSITTSLTSSVALSVQTTTDAHKTSSVAPSPQTSITTSLTSSVSLSVQTTTDAHKTSVVGSSPQTSITTSFTSSVSINATSAPKLGWHIVMTFKMSWRRLCFLLSLFKEALSDDLIEMKGLKYKSVNPGRIKFTNNVKCENKAYYNDNAVLKFYISDNRTEDLTSNSTVDKEMTIKAFKILYYYWVNKRMILLDKIFEKKVEKVELKGTNQDPYIPKYTEAQRIGIGIGVGLAVVVLILLIYCCVRRCVEGKSVGHSTEEKRMVFTNTVAINEDARTDTEGCEDTGSIDTPRSDLKKTEEPEEVVIHTQPLAKTQDEMPLRSVINDNEGDQTESDEKSDTEKAPLAKPEPDNVSEGEPIKSIDEPEAEPIKSPDEPEGEPANKHEAAVGSEDAPPVSKPSVTEKPPETGEDTVTSSMTIVITPDSGPATIEFPVAETALEPASEDDVKPDFGQSDNIDVDPSQGAINMAFDDKDEATGEGDEEEDEETKF